MNLMSTEWFIVVSMDVMSMLILLHAPNLTITMDFNILKGAVQ